MGLGNGYAELAGPAAASDPRALAARLALFEHAERLGAFDAVLAATASAAGAEALVSADAAFSAVEGPRHVMPDAAGVASLL